MNNFDCFFLFLEAAVLRCSGKLVHAWLHHKVGSLEGAYLVWGGFVLCQRSMIIFFVDRSPTPKGRSWAACPPSPVAAARLTPLSSGARRPELGGKPSPVPGVDKQRDKPLYGTANLLGPCFCLGCCNALSIVLSYLMSTNT